MKEINLRRVDLNLLTVFEAVYEERSQVKAAERLCMTQSAISHALTRLRSLTGDRLFTATSRGLNPTQDAVDLYARVHVALELIRDEFHRRARFDPKTSQRTFVVAFAYGGGTTYGLPLFRRLRERSPGVRLVIRAIDPVQEIPTLLREHRLDLAIDAHRFDDAMLETEPAAAHRLLVMARADHPRIKRPPSLDDLRDERFVTVYESAVEAESVPLRRLFEHIRQATVMEVPTALLVPRIVASTELLSLTTERMAADFKNQPGVVCYPLAADIPPVEAFLIWHRAMTNDPAHRWLREEIRAVIDDQAS